LLGRDKGCTAHDQNGGGYTGNDQVFLGQNHLHGDSTTTLHASPFRSHAWPSNGWS
jgi:hypothetical protein